MEGLLADDPEKGLKKKKSIDDSERFDILVGRGFFNCYSVFGAYISLSGAAAFGLPLVIIGEGFRMIYNYGMRDEFIFRSLVSRNYIEHSRGCEGWKRDLWKDIGWTDHSS